jgi:hypothetical protein
VAFKIPTKKFSFFKFFRSSVFKDKFLRSHNTVKSKFFLIFLLDDGESGSVLIIPDPDLGSPKNYGSYASGSGTWPNIFFWRARVCWPLFLLMSPILYF